MGAIVEIRDLVKYYHTGDNVVKAVDHTDLDIERGKFTAIVGRSGSGKSTLLHIMGGLDCPDSITKLSVHHLITRFGLRSDLGFIAVEDAEIAMMYLDAEGFDMYQMELSVIVVVVLVIVQSILTLVLGKSLKKESLIDRIRFSN